MSAVVLDNGAAIRLRQGLNRLPHCYSILTTHSESLARTSQVSELWLVNKLDGKTVAKNAAQNSAALGSLNLDTAWLMNMFDGGLPW